LLRRTILLGTNAFLRRCSFWHGYCKAKDSCGINPRDTTKGILPMANTAAAPRATLNRPDTLFGICEAIGQDFGINPLWLRLAIVPAVFFAPVTAILGYLAAGLVVLASRLLFPVKTASVAAPTLVAETPAAAMPAAAATTRDVENAPMALAA
jgi:phage shock protein C